MAEHPLCDADDCPCFLSGVEMTRLELADRHLQVVEAMSGLVEMLSGVDAEVTDG